MTSLFLILTSQLRRYTEIKCHSLLPLDEIVHIATHQDCIPEIKIAYVNFLNHCYVDTEVGDLYWIPSLLIRRWSEKVVYGLIFRR